MAAPNRGEHFRRLGELANLMLDAGVLLVQEHSLISEAKRAADAAALCAKAAQAAGARAGAGATLVMRAVDGYTVELPLKQAREQGFIIATHIDGAPLHVGGLGPLWAVYEPDRFPALSATV